MTVETIRRNGYAVLSPQGDIDMRTSPRFRDALLRALDGGDVVVDLSGVERIDTSGLASLVEALDAARRSGRNLALAGVGPGATNMLRLARLDRVFPIRGSVEEAAALWRDGSHRP